MSRLTVLKKQRQARHSVAHSDVVQLLNLGHHEQALVRIDQVIKEQNMLDMFVMIESYCHTLIERVNLIEQAKECPNELKEAISSLLYAATRYGELPELQEIRAVFTSHFGKDFVIAAIELHNNCGVNPKMIQMLSTKQPSSESKLKVLKEIASANGITLQFEEASMVTREEILDVDKNRPKSDLRVNSGRTEPKDDSQILPHVTQNFEDFSDSMKGRRKYRDVAEAAQVAFESAAAARSAVELSRSESFDPGDQSSPSSHSKTESYKPKKSKFQTGGEKDSREIQPIQNYHSESEDEEIYIENKAEDSKHNVNATEFIISASSSGSNSAYGVLKEISSTNSLGKEMVFDKSNDERENEQSGPWGAHESDFDMRHSSVTNDVFYSEKSDNVKHEDISQGQGSGANLTLRSRNDLDVRSAPGNPKSDSAEGSRMQGARRLDAENEPLSVRTRWVPSQMTKRMRGVK